MRDQEALHVEDPRRIELDPELERHQFCYLTTSGRQTGRPHRIEIWFVIIDGGLAVMSGGGRRSDWVKNLAVDPNLILEVGDEQWRCRAAILDDAADHPARARLAQRYQGWREGQPLTAWARESLVVEITAIADG